MYRKRKIHENGACLCQKLTLLLLDNDNNEKGKKKKNPHLNFLKGTVLGVKEQGVGIRNRGQGSRDKG